MTLHTLRLNSLPYNRFGIYFPKTGTHILGFKDIKHARRCANFVALYKQKYLNYPPANAEALELVPPKNTILSHHIQDIKQEFNIVKEEKDDLDHFCILNNIGLLECVDFKYNFHQDKIDVNYSASIRHQFDPDKHNIELLNFLYHKE